MSDDKPFPRTSADAAFLEAIEAGIEELDVFPERATFVDAEDPHAGTSIAEAAAEGMAVVLCLADGSRQILYPSEPAAA